MVHISFNPFGNFGSPLGQKTFLSSSHSGVSGPVTQQTLDLEPIDSNFQPNLNEPGKSNNSKYDLPLMRSSNWVKGNYVLNKATSRAGLSMVIFKSLGMMGLSVVNTPTIIGFLSGLVFGSGVYKALADLKQLARINESELQVEKIIPKEIIYSLFGSLFFTAMGWSIGDALFNELLKEPSVAVFMALFVGGVFTSAMIKEMIQEINDKEYYTEKRFQKLTKPNKAVDSDSAIIHNLIESIEATPKNKVVAQLRSLSAYDHPSVTEFLYQFASSGNRYGLYYRKLAVKALGMRKSELAEGYLKQLRNLNSLSSISALAKWIYTENVKDRFYPSRVYAANERPE
ncbi:hypothetical protein BVY03_04900 [bacterium K02(2017)]|nr:hypothetical protein BVY03_04900 [bacterium K02(2017)]